MTAGCVRMLALAVCCLLATVSLAADKATIKKNVDDIVAAINAGKAPIRFAAETYTPYVFIMEPNGRLIVHPYLTGEYLQEKAPPVHEALQKATTQGLWVSYFWKGAQKETYVRTTDSNLTVGSGQ